MKQENMARSKKQNKTTETIPDKSPTMDLLDKDIKVTVLKYVQKPKGNCGQSKGNQENNVGTKWDYQQSSRNYKKESKELKKAISKIKNAKRVQI